MAGIELETSLPQAAGERQGENLKDRSGNLMGRGDCAGVMGCARMANAFHFGLVPVCKLSTNTGFAGFPMRIIRTQANEGRGSPGDEKDRHPPCA